ncbi:glycoside hydrolase family 16 protein [Neolewinella persica]|uniref:glycoside hydrolase family 16 protein n=1 Tax=Neolewinella persica TaxID=70998 RepID=UPI000378EDC8|nr:glycoside hydrolase family 16 protein [Neolewinella persica]
MSSNLHLFFFIGPLLVSLGACAPPPESGTDKEFVGRELLFAAEFNEPGPVDTTLWIPEHGLVRNREYQWYQPQNAVQTEDGLLRFEARREETVNPRYDPDSKDWRKSRPAATWTSACFKTKGTFDFKYGTLLVRARLDTALGAWPAIWTLGVDRRWPANGEIDVMEFYQKQGVSSILANTAYLSDGPGRKAKWDGFHRPLQDFLDKDPAWPEKFHLWRMDWTAEAIRLYLDGELLNETLLKDTVNPDGFNPFQQPHYLLLNLAIGGDNGGEPRPGTELITYEVDWVRVYGE